MHIESFVKHDLITRSASISRKDRGSAFALYSTATPDYALMGDKLIFVGIESGMIFLVRETDAQVIKLPIELWAEGWETYPAQMECQAEDVANVLKEQKA